ncbi:MAG: hypothetical protein MUQ10_17225 [Anaerolineae bacterium]|nr:hypothetical protein [Anaerolineae bacterium]
MNRRNLVVLLGLVAVVVGLAGLVCFDSQALAQEAHAANPVSAGLDFNRVNMGSAHFGLDWNVLANGGNTMSSSHFHLSSTLGQTVIGVSDNTHFQHRAGYWQGFLSEYRIHLPLVLRGL